MWLLNFFSPLSSQLETNIENMAEAGLTILIHWVKSRNTNVDNKCKYSTDYPVHVQSVQQRKTEISFSMIFKLNCGQCKMQLDSVVSLIQES